MLLRFGVSNFRSIRDYAELSFVASDGIKDNGADLYEWTHGSLRLLPTILIYGANAAGKSSVYNAVGAIASHVLTSFSGRGATASIKREAFALDKQMADQPTHFDCDFLIDGVRYHFGFEFDSSQYLKEWLYSYPEKSRRVLYNRDHQNEGIDFGKTLKGRNKLIEDVTRPNSLFISAAAQNSHPQLTPIYKFFEEKLIGVGTGFNNETIQEKIHSSDDPRLVEFLRNADTGIASVKSSEEEYDESVVKILKNMHSAMAADFGEGITLPPPPTKKSQVRFSHAGSDGHLYELPFQAESKGTRKMASLVLSCLEALDRGATILVDELDSSLHTLLSLKLIEMFQSRSTNINGAQLVSTTHDTNILCSHRVRRDQIWFVEKDRAGGTNLYPLTDIKTRNTDNLEKGYLQGRFGAIPYLGSSETLFGEANVAA